MQQDLFGSACECQSHLTSGSPFSSSMLTIWPGKFCKIDRLISGFVLLCEGFGFMSLCFGKCHIKKPAGVLDTAQAALAPPLPQSTHQVPDSTRPWKLLRHWFSIYEVHDCPQSLAEPPVMRKTRLILPSYILY